MLFRANTRRLEYCLSQGSGSSSDEAELYGKLKNEHQPESLVDEKMDEFLASEFAADLVEEVHQEEGLEDDGVESHTIGWLMRVRVDQRSLDEIKRLLKENLGARVH